MALAFDVKELRCKTCDAVLDMQTAHGGVVECKFCRNVYTIPKAETKSDTRELLAIASHELDTCSFDRAYTAYSKAADTDESEPEAYFGKALAAFKVQYLKDAAKKHLQPVCHEVSEKKIKDDKNYKKALSLATSEQKAVYETRAEEIDSVMKEFNRLKSAGAHYDCFICVKVSDGKDAGGNSVYTQDSYEALKLYNHLKKRGYSPFYSEEEIRGKAGAEYEATILYALYTSECMLVVCSNEEYLQTPWVKNEYSRFMELINDERKDSDGITIVFKGKPIERLPGKRALIQGVNLNSGDAYAAIEDFVESHTPEAKARRAEAVAAKARQEEEIRRQIEEQKKAQRELEEKLESIRNQTTAAPVQSVGAGATVNSLLIRAKQEKKDGNDERARQYYEKVIDADPQNGEAWWGMFLLDMGADSGKSVLSRMDDKLFDVVTSNRNYRNACDYSAGDVKGEIDKFDAELKDPLKWYARFISEMGGKNEKDALAKVTQDKYNAAGRSRNLALAESFATNEVKSRIEAFKDRLDSSDTYFLLFLEQMGVRGESELLKNITETLQKKIGKNEYFKKALKNQDKASPDYAKRISDFYDALYGAETEWKLFLENFEVHDENKLFERCYFDMRNEIDDNEHYSNALALTEEDDCDPVICERIVAFEKRLRSPDTAWQILLAEYDVKSGNALASKITTDDMLAFEYADPKKKPKDNWRNEYYAELKEYADGKTKTEFDAFDKCIHSYELWHGKMLELAKAKSEQDYLDNKFSYVNTKDIMFAAATAGLYAKTAEQKKSIDAFTAQLGKQHELAGKALDKWAALQKKIHARSDDDMRKNVYCGKIGGYAEAKEALSLAAEAKDGKLKERFESVIAEQESRVGSAKSAKTKNKLGKVFTAVSVALSGVMLLTAIIAVVGISPIWEFWAIWYSSVVPGAGWLAFPIILGLAFTAGVIVMAVKQKGTKAFKIMRILSTGVSAIILITALAFLPAGLGGTGNVHAYDGCIAVYAENDTGYTLKKIEYTDSNRTEFEIPSEYNGKPVTEIGYEAFDDCETLKSIIVPNTVRSIGERAFRYCTALESITLPDSVRSIDDNAFVFCSSLKTVVLGNNLEKIGMWAFDCPIESITIPASVTEIGEKAFNECRQLGSVIFEDVSGWKRGERGIAASELSSPSSAATLLRDTYAGFTWNKTAAGGSVSGDSNVEESGLIKVSKKGEVICTVGNRDYKKTNDGVAYAAIAYINGYTGPVLVGEDENCIIYNYTYSTTKNVIAKGSFEYNGKTYYYTQSEGFMSGDRRGEAKDVYTCKNTTLLEAAKEIAALID